MEKYNAQILINPTMNLLDYHHLHMTLLVIILWSGLIFRFTSDYNKDKTHLQDQLDSLKQEIKNEKIINNDVRISVDDSYM